MKKQLGILLGLMMGATAYASVGMAQENQDFRVSLKDPNPSPTPKPSPTPTPAPTPKPEPPLNLFPATRSGGWGVMGEYFFIKGQPGSVPVAPSPAPSGETVTQPGESLGMILSLNNRATHWLDWGASAFFTEGEMKSFMLETNIRMTPRWFGADGDYLFGMIGPYLSGGTAMTITPSPGFNFGYQFKAGVELKLAAFAFDLAAGYRSLKIDSRLQLDSPVLSGQIRLIF